MARKSRQMRETPLCVGSGSFKVDRRLALEKLKEFQLPDSDMFLLPWIRCAVASGATSVTLDLDSSKIRFKTTFTREELSDPYGCMFDEADSARPRNRQLAYALLATLRRLEGSFTLTSGRGLERLSLRVKSLEEPFDMSRFCPQCKAEYRVGFTRCSDCDVALVEHVESGTDTVVNLKEGVWFTRKPLRYSEVEGVVGVSRPVEYALDHHIPEIISIQVLPEKVARFIRNRSDKPRPPLLETDHILEFRKRSLRGWLHVPGRLKPDSSRLRLSHFGMVVESVEGRSVTPVVPVEGTINDNGFELNLSQSGVVRNERYNAVMQETAAPAEDLVSKVCRTQAACMQAAGQRKSLLLQRAWARWFRLGEEAETGGFWSLDHSFGERMRSFWNVSWADPEWTEANRRLTWSTARATAWLRHLCALARNEQLSVAEKTLTDLKSAPIFWGLNETLLSMADLESTLFKLGYVPVSAQKGEGNPRPYPVVWAWCAEERAALDQIFPGQVADITEKAPWIIRRVEVTASANPEPKEGVYIPGESIRITEFDKGPDTVAGRETGGGEVPTPVPASAEQTRETESPQAEAAAPAPQEPLAEPPVRKPVHPPTIVTPDSLATQSDGQPAVLQVAHHILSHLCGRGGMELAGQSVPPLRLQRASDGGLLDIRSEKRWQLNDAHPLTKAMLDSSLSDSEKSAYLASVVYTAANRNLASVTDQDDVEFQQALADHLTEGLKYGP